MAKMMRGTGAEFVHAIPLAIGLWIAGLAIWDLLFGLPGWLAVTVVHLIEVVAGISLGLVGVFLTGDYIGWHKSAGKPGNPKLSGLVLLTMYLIALYVWRYV